MAEWFKAHAWKACVGNTTVGSNPTLSAISFQMGKLLDFIGFCGFLNF